MISINYDYKNIDLDRLNSLFESVGMYALDKDYLFKMLSGSYKLISLHEGEDVIGFGRAVGDGGIAILWDICVRPNYQKQGYGSLIIRSLENMCKESGVEFMILTVEDKNIEYYEHRDYIKQDLSVMFKELNK